MPYDIYRHWTAKGMTMGRTEIEKQVLEDLGKCMDETDRLEVLDSYRAFIEREQQRELADHLANLIFRGAQPLLVDAILARMPGALPLHRGRAAPAPIKEEK